jgi:hypothetical protein
MAQTEEVAQATAAGDARALAALKKKGVVTSEQEDGGVKVANPMADDRFKCVCLLSQVTSVHKHVQCLLACLLARSLA